MYNICWYARDGHLDLFPKISTVLRDLNVSFRSLYVCHHDLEAEHLREVYGIIGPDIIGKRIKRAGSTTRSAAVIARLRDEYQGFDLVRCMWGELFELQLPEEQIVKNLVSHFEFWEDFLATNQIDLLVSERPSILSTCVAWIVCKKLGIQFADFIDIPLDGRMVISTSWEGHFDGFEENRKVTNERIESEDLARAIAYVNRMLTRPEKTLEAKVEMERSRKGVCIEPGTLRYLAELPSVLRRAKVRQEYYVNRRDSLLLRSKYWLSSYLNWWRHRLVTPFESSISPREDRYFLMPLHRLREWSNYSWMGPGYGDQLAAVRNVAHCLPPGTYLYVKEHTGGLWERPVAFYRELKQLRQVKLVDPYSDTFHLIRSCAAVVTFGSTMGFEAVLLDRPVVLLGKPWYHSLSGVHYAAGLEDLCRLLHRSGDLAVSTYDEKVQAVHSLFKISFEGVKLPHSGSFQPDNIMRLAVALQSYIRKSQNGATAVMSQSIV